MIKIAAELKASKQTISSVMGCP